MIRSVFVPNRGEIAVRIARACREMKIESVLGFSERDDISGPGRHFDRVVSLGDGDARKTYLDVGRVIDAARSAGCDAVHPGYGFLSERAELAAACEAAGIIFIGPRASSIEAMGSKAESRRLMARSGVPVVPGYDGDDQSFETFHRESDRIGYPLLVKASAGGGGKGMKIVRSAAELQPAIESAAREAEKSFGDGRLLIERYIEQPRHVEFQIFGHPGGDVVHLFERDCSIQRRHQKVVEESPAPAYPDELRQKMAAAAVAAARSVSYTNAGTVEFIVTPDGEFFFLEMNTRLQVEHPVTEMVTATDLVRAQIEVAGGGPLPWTQEQLSQRGHAIEVRIYAEDPANGFLPQTGRIVRYIEPSGPGIRIDSGVVAGTEVGVSFDPMLAKLIAWADTRERAIDRLDRALGELVVLGPNTNISWLRRVITHAEFRAGNVSTRFLGDHAADLERAPADIAALVAGAIAMSATRDPESAVVSGENRLPSVWELAGPWGRG